MAGQAGAISMSDAAPRPISKARAILIGTLWVNIPVMAITYCGWVLPILTAGAVRHGPQIGLPGAIVVIAAWIVCPFLLGWTWWSVNIPKWRLWAMQRTDDWPAVERAAIRAGLIWDETTRLGRLLSRTELWRQRDRRRQTALLQKHGRPPREKL